jgi:hypothetical protein
MLTFHNQPSLYRFGELGFRVNLLKLPILNTDFTKQQDNYDYIPGDLRLPPPDPASISLARASSKSSSIVPSDIGDSRYSPPGTCESSPMKSNSENRNDSILNRRRFDSRTVIPNWYVAEHFENVSGMLENTEFNLFVKILLLKVHQILIFGQFRVLTKF